jgi:hypothetical protein
MPNEDTKVRLEKLGWMLSRGLLWPYPECSEETSKKAMLFFGDIPPTLFEQRKAAMEREENFREWLWITDELVGSEWLEELRGEYGIDVIYVDNVQEVQSSLLRSFHSKVASLKDASAH